jgi:hypothetical protein
MLFSYETYYVVRGEKVDVSYHYINADDEETAESILESLYRGKKIRYSFPKLIQK